MNPYILYGGTFSRALGPQMVLEEGDIPYELRVVDMDNGEHFGEEFRKLNPAGFTPALVTPEGHVLHEAAGIMLYLADHHGLDLVPPPGDPMRGVMLAKFFFYTNDVQPAFKRFGYPQRYALREEDIAAARAQARAAICDRLAILENWLQNNGPWHLGERFSIADLHLALWSAYGLETFDTIVEMFPAIGRVRAGVLERPKSGPLLKGLIDLMVERRKNRPMR